MNKNFNVINNDIENIIYFIKFVTINNVINPHCIKYD